MLPSAALPVPKRPARVLSTPHTAVLDALSAKGQPVGHRYPSGHDDGQ